MMLKYVETFQNKTPYLASDATSESRPLCSPIQNGFQVSSFVHQGERIHATGFCFNTYIVCFGVCFCMSNGNVDGASSGVFKIIISMSA